MGKFGAPDDRWQLFEVPFIFPVPFISPGAEFPLDQCSGCHNGAGRHVNIYGGLAFHPKLGLDSLVLATLHEAGHHLSVGSRSPQNVTLACECAADFWSVTEGAFLLRERSGRHFRLDIALEEFSRIGSGRTDGACRERNDFVMIVALDPPDFRTISGFRKRHLTVEACAKSIPAGNHASHLARSRQRGRRSAAARDRGAQSEARGIWKEPGAAPP